MSIQLESTEVAILDRVIQPDSGDWPRAAAEAILGIGFNETDPDTGELTPLFNPRSDAWSEHFAWDGVWLRGKTAIGRATVTVLDINHVDSLAVREALGDEKS